jgi:hypothetical protein
LLLFFVHGIRLAPHCITGMAIVNAGINQYICAGYFDAVIGSTGYGYANGMIIKIMDNSSSNIFKYSASRKYDNLKYVHFCL